jgi:hypothetical protein
LYEATRLQPGKRYLTQSRKGRKVFFYPEQFLIFLAFLAALREIALLIFFVPLRLCVSHRFY